MRFVRRIREMVRFEGERAAEDIRYVPKSTVNTISSKIGSKESVSHCETLFQIIYYSENYVKLFVEKKLDKFFGLNID